MLFLLGILQNTNANNYLPAVVSDSSNQFIEVKIDTVLTISLPGYYTYENEYYDDVHSRYWMAYNEDDDTTFIVSLSTSEYEYCLGNLEEMKIHYNELSEEWKAEEPEMEIIDDFQQMNKGIYLANLGYTLYDSEYDETYKYDHSTFQVKENLYQVIYIHPVSALQNEIGDQFLKSISIDDDFKGVNQFTACSNQDPFNAGDFDRLGLSAYNIGMVAGGAICVLLPLGLIMIIALVIYNKRKKKKQEEWNKLNG